MNCQHCVEGEERKWHNSTDNRMRMKLTKKKKAGGNYKQLRMVVHWNSWKMIKEMDTHKNSVFKINYCPMCGRELDQ